MADIIEPQVAYDATVPQNAVASNVAVDPAKAAQQKQEAFLQSHGIQYDIRETETADGIKHRAVMITSIPDSFQETLRFFLDPESNPCWFTGCNELREQYKKEKESKADCSECQEGALIRKYSTLVEEAIHRDKIAKHELSKLNESQQAEWYRNTGAVGVPGIGEGSGGGATQQQGLLRRAAKRIAKVFGFNK